jgi:hypothetical protein
MTPFWLRALVVAAGLFAAGGLTTTILATRRFRPRQPLAPPEGSEWQGVQYALFAGMMPWAKESARRHLPTYFTGITYHVGIAAGLLTLVTTLLSSEATGIAKIVLSVLTILGAAAGIGLLAKRAVTPALRAISTPDDVISNGLVTLFLVAAASTLWTPQFAIVFLVIATVLLVYMPVGKIRHCFLFFVSRITFGRFFGRRRVLPHPAVEPGESHVGR